MPKGNVPSNTLFDFLIANKGMKNDHAISRKAGICPSTISKVRAGRAVSDEIRVSIMRSFNLSLAKLDELAPPAVKGGKK